MKPLHLIKCAVLLTLIFVGQQLRAQKTCADAIVIPSLPFSEVGKTTAGSVDNYRDLCGETAYLDGEDYVYKFTPTDTVCVTILVNNADNWVGLGVFNGCPSAATCVQVVRSGGTTNPASIPSITLNKGVTYYIIVDNWPPGTTSFDFSITECPKGIACANPVVIPSLPYTESNTTCGRTNNYNSTPGGCQTIEGSNYMSGEDMVYTYTPTTDTCISVMLTGTTNNWAGIFVLKACPNVATAADCIAKDGKQTNPKVIGVELKANVTYYIVVDTWSLPACTNYNLSITSCADGVTCGYPITVPSLPYSQSGTTCDKGHNLESASCGSGDYFTGEDVFYKYTAKKSGCVNITATGVGTWTGMFVFKGCPGSGNCVDFEESSGSGSRIMQQVPLDSGQTYYIVIDTYSAPDCTPYNISISECVDGTNCSQPMVIPSLPYVNNNTTCNAIDDFGDDATAVNYVACQPTRNNGQDFTYKYTAPRNQCINISLTNVPSRPERMSISVTTGCPGSAGSKCLALSDGGTAAPAPINKMFLFAGTTIYITVDGSNTYYDCTPFTLNIDTCAVVIPQCSTNPPASDKCSTAQPLCDFTGYCGSTKSTYTRDAPGNLTSVFCSGVQNNGWVTFAAGATTVNINIYFGNCNTGQGIQAMVFETNDCNTFVAKSTCYNANTATGSGTITATGLTVGKTYYLMVDGFNGDGCDYIIGADVTSGILIPVDAGPDVSICPGKSVTLTAINGNNIYNWKPGNLTTKSITVSPKVTTDYVVTSNVAVAGCPKPNTDTVRVNVVPTVTTTETVVNANTCSGTCDGSASLTISNGQAPYTTTWAHIAGNNPSVSNLCAGQTYTAITTDNLGCSTYDTVKLADPVIANFTFTTPGCDSLKSVITTSATSGTGNFTYTGPGTMNFVAGAPGVYNVLVNAYGVYTVTWTVSDGSCSNTISKDIEFRKIPTADFTFLTPACGSKSTDFTSTATVGTGNFTFTGPGAMTFGTIVSNQCTGSATNFGSYNVSWVVDNNGCTATKTKAVTFTAQPVATVNVTGPACNALTFSAATGATPGTGAWTFTGPAGAVMNFTPAGANNFNGSVSTYGTYTATWTVTNGPCSANTTVTIDFYKKPTPNAGADANICALNTTLNATPSVGTGIWSQLAGPDLILFTPDNTPSTDISTSSFGCYDLIYAETNGTCPTVNDTIKVCFFENPAGNAGLDHDTCGYNAVLDATATIGVGSWSGAGVAAPANPNSAVSTTSGGSRTYTWTVTNGSCPAFVDDVVIRYYQIPTPNAGADNAVCGFDVPLDAAIPVSSGSWIAPATATFDLAVSPKTTAHVTSYGTYDFVWEEANGPCPASRDTVKITFVETPNPKAGPDQAICGLSTTFNADPSAFGGTWTGVGNIVSPNSRTSTIISSSYGTFNYVWTETNAAPCPSKTDTVKITFVQQTVANAGPDRNVCGKTTSPLTMNAARSVAGSTGTWSGPPGISFSTTSGTNPTVTSTSFGAFTVYWTETNTGTCAVSVDSAIVQFVPPTNPEAGPNDSVCGLSTALNAIPSYGAGAWNYSGPGIITFSDITDPKASITADTYGRYKLNWTEDNKPCAANSDSVFVNFFETPFVEAGASPVKVCGLIYNLTATPTVGKGKWTWTADAGVTGTIAFTAGNDSTPDAEVTASDYGRYFFTWTVVNGTCTPPADVVDLTFFKLPEPQAGNDTSVCDVLTVPLHGITSVAGQWKWSSKTGGTVSFSPNDSVPDPIATVTTPGIYTLYFSEVNDPVCGVITDSMNVEFQVLPSADAGPDADACGSNYIMAAANPPFGTGKWTFVSASDGVTTATFSDDTLYNTLVTISPAPPPTGVDVTFEWTMSNGVCPTVSDQVTITFKEVPNQVDAGPNDTICGSLTTTIHADDHGATGTWSILSMPAGASGFIDIPGDELTDFTGTMAGIYILQRSATVAGCASVVTDVTTIDFRTKPTPNVGPDTAICGRTYFINGKVPSGRITGAWTQISGPTTATISNPTSAQTTVSFTGSNHGVYVFRWTESNLSCADEYDEITINFNRQPRANAGPDIEVCNRIYDMAAVPSPASTSPEYTSLWTQKSGPGTTAYSDPTNSNAKATATNFGTYEYYWTETNGVCNVSKDSVIIKYVNPSSPEAGLDTNVCGLQDTMRAVPSYGTGTWTPHSANPYAAVMVNYNDPHTIVTVPDYGVYRFDWLEANSPCFANSDSTVIHFNQQPTAYAGIDKDTCSLVAILEATNSVSGVDYKGSWSGPAGAVFGNPFSPVTTVDVTSIGYGTHTFTWTEVNGSRCAVSTDNVKITFLQTPIADVGANPLQTCGKTLKLNALPTVGTGVWTGVALATGTANFISQTNPKTTTFVDNYGLYFYTWTETTYGPNGGSCSSQDTFTVGFYPQPNAYAGKDSTVCGQVITLNATQSVAASTMSWQIVGNPANASFSSTNTATTTVTMASGLYGTYKFVFGEDIGGGTCFSYDTVAVTFLQQPIAEAGIGDSICTFSAPLQAVPTVGSGSWSSVTAGVVFSPNLNSPNVTVTMPTFGIYKFVWKEDNGSPCSVSRDTVIVGVFQTPKPKAGADFSVCGTAATLNGIPTSYTCVWSYLGTRAMSFDNTADPKTTARLAPTGHGDYGLHVFRMTESNMGVCSAFDDVNVFFSEQPIANAGVDQAVCGLDFTLNSIPSVGNGRWDFIPNDTNLVSFNNTTSPTANGTMKSYGTYDFNWIERNPGLCPADSDTVAITFNEMPKAYAGRDTSVCSMTYTVKAVRSIGAGTWRMITGPAGGMATFGDVNTDTTSVMVNKAGTYRFEWSEFNAAPCPTSRDTVQVYFEQAPVANAGPDFDVCGLSTNLQAVPSIGTGNWTFIGDPEALVTYGNASSATTSITSTKYGAHPLIWTETNTAVCGPRTDTVVITLIRQPIAQAGPASLEVCGVSRTLEAEPSAGIGQWSQYSGPTTGSFVSVFNPQTLFTIPTSGFGTYQLAWSEFTASPCVSDTDLITISFSEQPVANAGPDQEICGLEITLAAIPSVGSGHWILNPSGTQSVIFVNDKDPGTKATVSEYGVYQFVWEETNGVTCTPSQEFMIATFYEQPIANAGMDNIVCGPNDTLKAVASAGVGSWSVLNSTIKLAFADSTNDTTVVSAAIYGVYQLQWKEVNGKTCAPSTDLVTVEFVQQPVAKTAGNDRVCGLTYVLDATPSVGIGEWVTDAPGASFNLNINDPKATVTVGAYNNFNFTWTETNKSPCISSSDNINIEFINPPVATLSATPTTVCSGAQVKLTVNASGTGPFTVEYTINGVAQTPLTGVSNGYQFTHNPTINSTYLITKIIDGSGIGCESTTSNSVPVTVLPRPTAGVANNYVICSGDSLSIPITVTGTPPFTIQFDNGDTRVLSSPPYEYRFKPGTLTNVSVQSVGDANCTGNPITTVATITSNPLPVADIQHNNTANICAGGTTQLTLNFPVGKAPFRVYMHNGGFDTIVDAPGSGYSFTVTPPTGTTSYVVDSVIDGNGCRGTGNSVPVTVYANPTVLVTAVDTICAGSGTNMVFSFTPAGTGPWDVAYTFDGNAYLANDKTSGGFVTIAPPASTTVYFKWVSDKGTGCMTNLTDSLPIEVIPQPTLSATIDKNEICRLDSANITLQLTGFAPFSVTLSDGSSVTDILDGEVITVRPSTTQTYTVTSFKDGSGLTCNPTNDVNITLVVNQLAVIDFNITDTVSCAPMMPTFTNNTNMSDVAAANGTSWSFGDGGVDTSYTPTHEYEASGTYPVTLVVTTPKGCIDSLTKITHLTINPDPVADFTWDPEHPDVVLNDVRFLNGSTGGVSFEWNINNDTIFKDFQCEYIFPSEDSATYNICLKATSVDGCENTKCKPLTITGRLSVFVPNTFTPNNDGLNDVFIPSILGADIEDYELIVYNRWGDLVFKSTDPSIGWNGTMKDHKIHNDIFSWKIEFKDKYTVERHKYYGRVNLVR